MKNPCLRLVRPFLTTSLCLLLGGTLDAAISVALHGDAVFLRTQTPPGSSVTMSLQPSSDTALGDVYQWYFDDQPLADATATTLRLDGLAPAQAGNYRLRRTSTDGYAEFSNTLTLNIAPPLPSLLDPSFYAQLPAGTAAAWPLALTANGDVFVRLRVDNGAPVVRLHADGSLDSGFTFPANAGQLLAVFPDGRSIVSQTPYRLAADGSAAPFALPSDFDSAQPLAGALVLPNGQFLIAQAGKVVRLNADGTVDTAFSFTSPHLDWINSLQLDPAGRVLVSGGYYVIAGGSDTLDLAVRLATDGTVDPDFAAVRVGYREHLAIYPVAHGYLLYRTGFEGQSPLYTLLDEHGRGVAGQALPEGWGLPGYPIAVDASGRFYVHTGLDSTPKRYSVTAAGLVQDPSFATAIDFGGSSALLEQPDGRLLVYGSASAADGLTTPNLVRLNPALPVGHVPATLARTPNFASAFALKDSTVGLTTETASGETPTYQWLALDGQPLPADTTSATLTLANFSTAQLGRYQVRVANSTGSTLSNVVDLTLPTSPGLVNLSGRAAVGEGEEVVIAGLTTHDTPDSAGRVTLLRGVGPGLEPQGVTGFLPNPALQLFNPAGQLIDSNDQWADTDALRGFSETVGAFPLVPGSNDAAFTHLFSTSQATLHLIHQGPTSGVGLIEVYQLSDLTNPSTLINLSFRAKTAPGEATAIAGFVVDDPQDFGRPARVLLRAVGPTLSTQGIVHPLANPVLTLYNHKGEVVAQNDEWSVSPANKPTAAADLAAAMKHVGAFDLATDSHDAALLLDLAPGAYTMHATGGTGVVLLEIYLVK